MAIDPFFDAEAAVEERPAFVPGERVPLQEFMLEHRQKHKFVKVEGRRGCGDCGGLKKDIWHHGFPSSFNIGGSGRNHFAYQNEKKMWSAFFIEAMDTIGLPRGLGKIHVEGTLTFPTRRMNATGPDQGNFRFSLEKFLGDALEEGGWIKSDNWLTYTFGNLEWRYEKGVRGLQLVFFPDWEPFSPEEIEPERPTLDLGID